MRWMAGGSRSTKPGHAHHGGRTSAHWAALWRGRTPQGRPIPVKGERSRPAAATSQPTQVTWREPGRACHKVGSTTPSSCTAQAGRPSRGIPSVVSRSSWS